MVGQINEGYRELCCGIVKQAVDDYRDLLNSKINESKLCNQIEIENFFNSEWFTFLINGMITGREIISMLQKEFRTEKMMTDLRKLIKRKGYKLTQIADLLDLSEPTISMWMRTYDTEHYTKIMWAIDQIELERRCSDSTRKEL